MPQFYMSLNVTDDLKTFFKKALSSYCDEAAAILQSEHAVIFFSSDLNVVRLLFYSVISSACLLCFRLIRKIHHAVSSCNGV
jgi:hypothetical protein